jgi:hypothetical protein
MSKPTDSWFGSSKVPSVAELVERYAIEQLAKRYALGMDLRDYELCRSAFAPNGIGIGKNGPEPIDTYLPNTYKTAASFQATQHVISNQYIDINGDEAVAWSYGVVHHKVAKGETRDEIIAGVQYRDKCQKFSDGWLIVERSVALQWMDMAPPR